MTLDPKKLTEDLLDTLRADVTDNHEYRAVLEAVQGVVVRRANEVVQVTTLEIANLAAKQILAARAATRGVTLDALAGEFGVTAKAMTDNAAQYLTAVKLPEPAQPMPKP